MTKAHVLLVSVALTTLGLGCFQSSPDDDAGPGADGGELCHLEPSIDLCRPRCTSDCPAGLTCDPGGSGICLPERSDMRYWCELPEASASSHDYCVNGDVCAFALSGDRSSNGVCISRDVCDPSASEALELECRYSDGSFYQEGPAPIDTCPEPAIFCGSPCAGCASELPVAQYFPSCIGISETRGVGICAVWRPVCDEEGSHRIDDCTGFAGGRRCACAVMVDEAGVAAPWGHYVFEEACLAYQEMYPDLVECRDADWALL